MPEQTWYGTPIRMMRRVDDFWLVVEFQEKCNHFRKGQKVCISRHNILPKRTPVHIDRLRVEEE